ncbi:hypothetical protein NDU88_000934 [Pleurodeles waltl]|uniref:Uncharacterized protein n=1 Tax=Pleurodeles waltl TaxID=8319 RepID=A0AAV7UUT8_PLEWA|nr:hypothetical protein NDU88_000934 [Pleurodeles waltl]
MKQTSRKLVLPQSTVDRGAGAVPFNGRERLCVHIPAIHKPMPIYESVKETQAGVVCLWRCETPLVFRSPLNVNQSRDALHEASPSGALPIAELRLRREALQLSGWQCAPKCETSVQLCQTPSQLEAVHQWVKLFCEM